MKNLLAENMLRFRTKNLSEQDLTTMANASSDIAQDQKMFHEDIIKKLKANPDWKEAPRSFTTSVAAAVGLKTQYETQERDIDTGIASPGTALDTAPQVWMREKYKRRIGTGTQPEQLIVGFKDGELGVFHFNARSNANQYDRLYGRSKSTNEDKEEVLSIISDNLEKTPQIADAGLSESELHGLHEQTDNVQQLVKKLFILLLTHVKQMTVGSTYSDRVLNNADLLREMVNTQNAIGNMLYKYEKRELVDSIEKFNMFKQDVANLIANNTRILNYPGAVPQAEVDKILTQIETALNV